MDPPSHIPTPGKKKKYQLKHNLNFLGACRKIEANDEVIERNTSIGTTIHNTII
jgi:hypothetical protein